MRGNASSDKYYPDFACNSIGLRGELPPNNRKVILILGDSFAEGAGAPSDSTFPALLQHLIEQHDTTYAVMNAGVSGNDPFFDWMMLRKLRDRFDIRHVVFMINTTDLNDLQMRGGLERFLPHGGLSYRKGPWWEPIYAISHVSRLFVHGPMGRGMNLMTTDEDYRTRQESLKDLSNLLNDVVLPYTIQHDIVMHVVLHPIQHELSSDAGPYPQLVEALDSLDSRIKFSDTFAPIMHAPNIEELYWPTDRHFTPVGYAKMANIVYDEHFSLLTPSLPVQ
jgi:lysophospholipase L1-like esterase